MQKKNRKKPTFLIYFAQRKRLTALICCELCIHRIVKLINSRRLIRCLFELYRDALLEVKLTFVKLRQIFLIPCLAIICRLLELLALKDLMQNGDFMFAK
jgi:hypothetical protein